MLEAKLKENRRWILSCPGLRVNCRTKENAIRWGRLARQAGKDVSLTEEYDLFDRGVLIDHQEFDRTILIKLSS